MIKNSFKLKFPISLMVFFIAWGCYLQPGTPRQNTTITILETSDVHGNIYNWDFFGEKEYDQGLAMVTTLVKRERQSDKDLILLDDGDTIQGTPLIYYYNTPGFADPNPMALVMNNMKYDAMTIGNHEFNYGQKVLDKFINDCEFPVISANIVKTGNGQPKYQPYLIKTVKGIKIGIIGLTTPGVPIWEKPENIEGLQFKDAVATAQQMVKELKQQGVQVIIALAHTGPHVEPLNSRDAGEWLTDYHSWVDKGYADLSDENFAIKLAEKVPEVDVILAGHAHSTIPMAMIDGTLLTEPYKWGRGISKVTLTINPAGKVIEKHSEYISVKGIAPDSGILQLAKKYQETALEYVNSEIGTAVGDFPGGRQARMADGPLADFINAVQFEIAKAAGYPADISLSAIFNNRSMLRKGPIEISDLYGIYQFDNTLNIIEITGSDLVAALEHDAEYWTLSSEPGEDQFQPSGKVRDYNWDMYSGIEYAIDISRPVGQRVVKLTFQGSEVRSNQKFRVAVNNYRAGGGGGYEMFKNAVNIWKSTTEIRDYMIEYVRQKKVLDPAEYYVQNWYLINGSVIRDK
ncbi:MAG: bifunctional metallophosphatase/5'-nucleotidase [FCB group bacterium]|nr:bifunctional metallophosphatase/5'-nucleotidase [FCB group bacterium]